MHLQEVYNLLQSANLLQSGSSPFIHDIPIEAIATDSRQIKPGSLFVAIDGLHYDGHDFILEAVQKGAVAVISQHQHQGNLPVPVLQVVNSRQAAAILSAYYWGQPGQHLICLGVTGTNGKTTTTFMIDAILEEAGYCTGLIGTVLTKIAGKIYESSMTTPDAPTLHHLLHHMVESQVEAVAMEVSSHGIVQDRCYGLPLDAGVLTNISYDHADIHPSFAEYTQIKLAFFRLVGPGGLKAVNGDDEVIQRALTQYPVEGVLRFGLSPHCQIRALDPKNDSSGSTFTLSWEGMRTRGNSWRDSGEISVELGLVGLHNIYNALGAATVALFLGVRPEVIVRGLKSFTGVSRRLQLIHDGDIAVIDDFAHNPASIRTAVRAVEGLIRGKLIIVNAIRGNRGLEINRENAQALANCIQENKIATQLIVTTSTDAVGSHDWVSTEEKEVFLQTLRKAEISHFFYPTLKKSLKVAIQSASTEDLILLLGAQGMDRGQEIFRQIRAETPKIAKADPYDELSKEPAIVGISEYLQRRG